MIRNKQFYLGYFEIYISLNFSMLILYFILIDMFIFVIFTRLAELLCKTGSLEFDKTSHVASSHASVLHII